MYEIKDSTLTALMSAVFKKLYMEDLPFGSCNGGKDQENANSDGWLAGHTESLADF